MLTFFSTTADLEAAKAVGFRFGHIGTHTSRTIMLAELTEALAAVPPSGKLEDYRLAIVEDNCLGKQTVSTRRLSLQRLRELYALDPAVPIFRILRRLWNLDPQSRPLVALLASLARDPLLLATASAILNLPPGAEFQRSAMREALAEAVEDRLNESTLDKVVRNAASSWSQSGHLVGRTFKIRQLVTPTPAAVAFAMYLARAAGLAVEESLSSGWVKALDCTASAALDWIAAAKRLGLVDLRMAGDVIELNLERLDPAYVFMLESR
jgi:hypothetical protein